MEIKHLDHLSGLKEKGIIYYFFVFQNIMLLHMLHFRKYNATYNIIKLVMFLCINIKYKYISAIHNGELMKARVYVYVSNFLYSKSGCFI